MCTSRFELPKDTTQAHPHDQWTVYDNSVPPKTSNNEASATSINISWYDFYRHFKQTLHDQRPQATHIYDVLAGRGGPLVTGHLDDMTAATVIPEVTRTSVAPTPITTTPGGGEAGVREGTIEHRGNHCDEKGWYRYHLF